MGGRLGAGLEFTLNNHFSTGLDYFHTRYQEMTTVSAPPFNTRFRQRASNNYIGISIGYTLVSTSDSFK